jgi:hypothetical protein
MGDVSSVIIPVSSCFIPTPCSVLVDFKFVFLHINHVCYESVNFQKIFPTHISQSTDFNSFLVEKAGKPGFLGYVLYSGNTVGFKLYPAGGGLDVQGLSFWILKATEVLVILILSVLGFKSKKEEATDTSSYSSFKRNVIHLPYSGGPTIPKEGRSS